MSRQAKIIVGSVIVVLLLSTVGTVIFLGKADSPSKPTDEMVRIEVRSMPVMTIQKDGQKLGQTPVSFLVAKSSKPISIDGNWVEQRIYRTGAKMIPRQAHKDVVPDRSMTVDITKADAMPVQMDKNEDPKE